MTELKRVHEYIIESKKMDLCPHKFEPFCMTLGLGSIFLTAPIGYFVGMYINNAIVGGVLMICAMFVSFFIGIYIPDRLEKCGVHIYLKDDKDCGCDGSYYQFTNNSDYDVEEIEKSVARLEKTANRLHEEYLTRITRDDLEKKQNQLCCNQYHDRILKVKIK